MIVREVLQTCLASAVLFCTHSLVPCITYLCCGTTSWAERIAIVPCEDRASMASNACFSSCQLQNPRMNGHRLCIWTEAI